MLNDKQGSCEYQLLKSFGLTQSGNRTLVYHYERTLYLSIEKSQAKSILCKSKVIF